MREESAVVAVETDGPVAKIGKRFFVRVNYRLADGRTAASTVGRDRKKDVLGAVARENDAAGEGRLAAILVAGDLVGTRTKLMMTRTLSEALQGNDGD